MQLPTSIRLCSSTRLGVLLLCAHLLATVAILPLMLPWSARLVLLGLVGLSLLLSLYRLRQLPVVALHLGARGELEIETKVGSGETATIATGATVEPHTTIFPGVIILSLRYQGKRLTLPLFADSVSGGNYRQLRLWLQWRAKTGFSASV